MNTWIYNKKQDLAVFGIPLIVAFLLGTIFREIEFIQTMFVYVFIDISHSFSTYFYTINSDRVYRTNHRYFFWSVPILIYTTICSLRLAGWGPEVLAFYTWASLYHFMKQSQAWIMIAGGKTRPDGKLEKLSNKLISFAAVFSPQIVSMTLEHPTPWFVEGDIPGLPMYFKDLAIAFGLLALALYLYVEIKRWKETKIIQWSKHFHVVNGFTIWTIARVGIFNWYSGSMGPLMMMLGHSVPYFYLGHRYLQERGEANERFWPFSKKHSLLIFSIWVCCLGVTYLQFWRLQFPRSLWISSIMVTGALAHYTFDSYLWSRKRHPEGAQVLLR